MAAQHVGFVFARHAGAPYNLPGAGPTRAPVTSQRIHFEGLNAVRFFAAAAVALSHASVVLMWHRLPNLIGWANSEVGALGWVNPETGKLAVICFFVLSGFLITYLLLSEEARSGAISIRAFYLRRILRIWPLYYLLVLCGFFVFPRMSVLALPTGPIPTQSWWRDFVLYGTIFPNLATPIPYLGHLWSIGVEEQFYILWPILLVTVRNRLRLLLSVIVAYLVALFAADPFLGGGRPGSTRAVLYGALYLFRIDCIALGGIAALILFHGFQPALRIMTSLPARILAPAALATLYLWNVQIPKLTYELYALVFAWLILNIAANPSSFRWLENRLLDTLGKISYGIYMYHPLAIVLTFAALRGLVGGESGGWLFSATLYGLGLASTVAIALVSYYGFEQRLLRLKLRVSTVVTGDLAEDPHVPVASDSVGPVEYPTGKIGGRSA
jgi:peptidoglycan/LPS O-acetylase OafA/YrhL